MLLRSRGAGARPSLCVGQTGQGFAVRPRHPVRRCRGCRLVIALYRSSPHAANKITETSSSGSANDHVYSYDRNGNNSGNTYMGGTRVLTWDEENRLKQVSDAGSMRAKFLYSPVSART